MGQVQGKGSLMSSKKEYKYNIHDVPLKFKM